MVKIELTDAQAFVLRMVLDRIGGAPSSRRGVADSINDQLISQGVEYNDDLANEIIDPNARSIFFVA